MSVYDQDNFVGRVKYAAAVISSCRLKNRNFDSCFEMHDGDAVAAAIWKRSLKNERIRINLPKYLNVEIARASYEELEGQNLSKAAAAMRAKAEAWWRERAVRGVVSINVPAE